MGRRGFSITELMLAFATFVLLMVLATAALQSTSRIWRNTSGRDSAIREIEKARQALERDLEVASVRDAHLWRSEVPGSLSAGGYDGDALNFLSAGDVYGNDGSAFWTRNVTYYLVVPDGHLGCAGHRDSRNYDDACPHKILLRQESDQAPVSDPADPLTIETLLPIPAGFPRPEGFPMTQALRTVAVNLLTFRTTLAPGGVNVDLRSVAMADASRSISIGSTPLGTGRFTLQEVFSVYPKN